MSSGGEFAFQVVGVVFGCVKCDCAMAAVSRTFEIVRPRIRPEQR
jgi:hypothetical protein